MIGDTSPMCPFMSSAAGSSTLTTATTVIMTITVVIDTYHENCRYSRIPAHPSSFRCPTTTSRVETDGGNADGTDYGGDDGGGGGGGGGGAGGDVGSVGGGGAQTRQGVVKGDYVFHGDSKTSDLRRAREQGGRKTRPGHPLPTATDLEQTMRADAAVRK